MKIIYSEQAKKLIDRLKDFDVKKFEAEYLETITIGDRAILDYIFNKDKK
jgi:hypothetical protein